MQVLKKVSAPLEPPFVQRDVLCNVCGRELSVLNQCSMPLRRSLGYSGLAFQGLPSSGDKPLAATLLHRYTAAVRTQFLRCQILSAVTQIAAMPRIDFDNGAWCQFKT
jgi:hypothetical protein